MALLLMTVAPGVTAAPPRGASRAGGVVAASWRATPPRSRNALGASAGFAATLTIARTVTYVMERRRPAPRARSVGRRLMRIGDGRVPRVHHYVPGLVLGLGAGGGGLLTREDTAGALLSVPFGVGVALTFDELGVLVGKRGGYWSSERLVVVQAATAWTATAVLAGRSIKLTRQERRAPTG